MAGQVVAYLEVRMAGVDADKTQLELEVHGNEQFYIGRNSDLCRHHWSDPTISNRHLRIHCILYEQDSISNIPPLVYATDLSTNGTYLKKANVTCASPKGRGIRMGRKTGAFLLDDGDELRISDSLTIVYHSYYPTSGERLTAIQEREKRLFSDQYLITSRVLGMGGYGKVMVAVDQKTQRQLACKVIDIHYLYRDLLTLNPRLHRIKDKDIPEPQKRWPSKVVKNFREFEILKDLNHPNIISIRKVFWSSNTIYLFQEIVTGGDLFSYIHYKGGRLFDIEAAVIIRQVLKGVEYLHGQDIVHRDLKPDNILMTSPEDGARIVITDFGNARFLPKHQDTYRNSPRLLQRMFSLAGTLEYTAPLINVREIHKLNTTIPADEGYSKSVDMWSIGSITGTMLSGAFIFANSFHLLKGQDSCTAILSAAARCDLSMMDDETNVIWRRVGSRPKDFIKKLLVLQEDRRMTVTEALAHSWFTNKHHAAEFEALYERSNRNWQPHPKESQVIESVSQISTDLAGTSMLGEMSTHETVSRFFSLRVANDVPEYFIESLHFSQLRRANTPLPSILEDREEGEENQGQMPQQSCDVACARPSQSVNQLSKQETIKDSLEQLSLSPKVEAPEPPALLLTLEDEIGSFIIPETPARRIKNHQGAYYDDSEDGIDPFTIPETPTRYLKRRRAAYDDIEIFDDFDKGLEEDISEQGSAFVRQLSKRRKLPQELY